MSEDIRGQITLFERWSPPLRESLGSTLRFIKGKPISLIKTLHTVGKWNDSKGEMDRVTKSEDINGFIGSIGTYEGDSEVPGFWIVDVNGDKMGYLMYNQKNDEFIEGHSMYHYTYEGKSEKDKRILQLVKDNVL
jgi:hypothetical protein